MLQNPLASRHYNLLQVSPLNARSSIIKLIQNEIAFAGQGQLAQITLKLNNLVDAEIIDELYKASQAGVKIRAIIRGMCSLKPGVKGLSENIQIISIVDRFLEHPRVLLFENGGDQRMYISSADWMMRNMDNRVEVGCPILDKKLIGRITRILDIQFEDTLKSGDRQEPVQRICAPRQPSQTALANADLRFSERPGKEETQGIQGKYRRGRVNL
ncbi:MAG: hypothetical protein ACE37N_07695 [Pseudohongiellaceae bacterium]